MMFTPPKNGRDAIVTRTAKQPQPLADSHRSKPSAAAAGTMPVKVLDMDEGDKKSLASRQLRQLKEPRQRHSEMPVEALQEYTQTLPTTPPMSLPFSTASLPAAGSTALTPWAPMT